MEIVIPIFTLIVLLLSVIIHEIAHGSMALYLGDPTAKLAGRLTLNPLRHLDLFGSIMVPLFLFFTTNGNGPIVGWTKPVPVNPYNFRDKKWGTLKVSISGPGANFLIATFFGLLIRFFSFYLSQALLLFFSIISVYNFAWGIFNLVPIPPLDGYHILISLLTERWTNIKALMKQYYLLLWFMFIFFGGFTLIFFGAELLYSLAAGF